MKKFVTTLSQDEILVVEKHQVFDLWEDFGSFQTMQEAIVEVKKIYKRVWRSNRKADSDIRPNSYGAQSLPHFRIKGGERLPMFTEKGEIFNY